MELIAEFVVRGKAEPQGSAQAFVPVHPKTKQPFRRRDGGIVVNVTSDNPRLKAWREDVAAAATEAFRGELIEGEGVTVEVVSYLKRPEGDWGTGRNAHLLKDRAPAYPIVIPDCDKLLRAILDAITDVIVRNDSVVTDAITRKRYAVPKSDEDDGRRAVVRVWRNEVQRAEQLPMTERVRAVPGRELAEPVEQPSLLAA